MIIDNNGNIYEQGCTHGGFHHLDETLCSAIFRNIDKDFRILTVEDRNKKLEELNLKENTIIYDVFDSKYDHHDDLDKISKEMKNFKTREDGSKRAAIGLVLKDFYKSLGLNDEQYQKLDNSFIRLIEDVDNGVIAVENSPYSLYLRNMNVNMSELKKLSWQEKKALKDARFEEMIEFSQVMLNGQIKKLDLDTFYNNEEEIKNLFNETVATKFGIEQKDTLLETIHQLKSTLEEDVFNKFEEKIILLDKDLNDKNSKYLEMIDCIDLSSNKDYAKNIISNIYENFMSLSLDYVNTKFSVQKAYENSESNYLILNEKNWKEVIIELNENVDRQIDFIISPTRERVMIQTVPKTKEELTSSRIPFPEEIRGLDIKNNDEISYSEGINFCHPGGHLASTKTVEDAINLVDKVTIENLNKLEL